MSEMGEIQLMQILDLLVLMLYFDAAVVCFRKFSTLFNSTVGQNSFKIYYEEELVFILEMFSKDILKTFGTHT